MRIKGYIPKWGGPQDDRDGHIVGVYTVEAYTCFGDWMEKIKTFHGLTLVLIDRVVEDWLDCILRRHDRLRSVHPWH